MIRLSKDAPWERVTLNSVVVTKTKWIYGDEINYYRPVEKWIEIKEDKKEEILVKGHTTDLTKLQKKDLISMCKEKDLEYEKKSKKELIDVLTISY